MLIFIFQIIIVFFSVTCYRKKCFCPGRKFLGYLASPRGPDLLDEDPNLVVARLRLLETSENFELWELLITRKIETKRSFSFEEALVETISFRAGITEHSLAYMQY